MLPRTTAEALGPCDGQLFELMFAPLEAGRPLALPPETPPDRLAALRAAFSQLAKDPEFLGEIASRGSSVELLAGHDTQVLVENLYRTPRDILARAREIRNQR
jgi:tripartite-type tricarboxylate transporter receptor subunit TctC